ncbi:MAG: hypothetical protein WCK21_12000, partial [Actinomycetota bacterium]
LTLQLRAAQQEAAQAEVAAAAADQAVARIQLRNKIDPMMEDRTRALDIALVRAREEAAAMVAAAHRQAAALVAGFDGCQQPLGAITDPGLADLEQWGFSGAEEPELERRRLEAALQEARARTAEAERQILSRQSLHVEVLDLQRQLAEMDTSLADAPVRIRAEAKAQAQQIIADARLRLAAKVGGPDGA